MGRQRTGQPPTSRRVWGPQDGREREAVAIPPQPTLAGPAEATLPPSVHWQQGQEGPWGTKGAWSLLPTPSGARPPPPLGPGIAPEAWASPHISPQ